MFAYLVAFRVIDERIAILAIHYRLVRTWAVIQPFAEKERVLRGGADTYLNTLEEFAKNVAEKDPRELGNIVRRNLSKDRRWLR
jgi:hypothetical protein